MSARKYKEDVYETRILEDRVTGLFYPQKALGSYVDDEMSESIITISYLVITIAVIGILSTLVYQHMNPDDTLVNELSIAIMSIGWIVFASFVFLLFGSTRFFHISLLIALVTLAGVMLKEMNGIDGISSGDKNMTIVVIVLGAVALAVLLYYWIVSRPVTDAKEYREKERLARMDNKYKDKIERLRVKHDREIDELERENIVMKRELEKFLKRREQEEKEEELKNV
jgi:FlaA1/EpsC-like NDP-sugar epimerase